MDTTTGAPYGTTHPVGPPRSGPSDVDSSRVDVDAACIMMDVRDLPVLIGEIVRPAKRRVLVRDSKHFQDWLHVISDPVVVKVYAGATPEDRQASKRSICQELRRSHRLALTLNHDNVVLSKSQVNIPVQALVEALRACGHRECRVGFFGMKWAIPKAQSKVDTYVQFHMAAVKRNQFDIGIVLSPTMVDIFRFGLRQTSPPRMYREGTVHEMLNVEGFGALQFRVPMLGGIQSIKIYQELTHEVLFAIPRENMDDMPKTVRTMRTRVEQFANLLEAWEHYEDDELKERLLGTRIEMTVVNVHTVTEAHNICLDLNLLSLRGLENVLGGPSESGASPSKKCWELPSPRSERCRTWCMAQTIRGRA